MILIYILSILSISSLFMQKSQPVQIEPVEENSIIEVKTVSKPQKIQNTDSEILDTGENNILDENIEETENSDILESDEYEEIIFQDDFDKKYREDVGDSYFWEPESIEE